MADRTNFGAQNSFGSRLNDVELPQRQSKRGGASCSQWIDDNSTQFVDLHLIADMAIWPWAQNGAAQEQIVDDKPHFSRWLDVMASRPAVQRGKALGEELRNRVQTEEEKREAEEI